MKKSIEIVDKLSDERVIKLRYLYIVIDSSYKIHYEFNNKGHIILPFHRSEVLPWKIYENLPKNLIRKCKSEKKNIIGVLQLWIYNTKNYSYADLRGLGVLHDFTGNKLKVLIKLLDAMDKFSINYKLKYISEKIMRKAGFFRKKNYKFFTFFGEMLFRQKHYVKVY